MLAEQQESRRGWPQIRGLALSTAICPWDAALLERWARCVRCQRSRRLVNFTAHCIRAPALHDKYRVHNILQVILIVPQDKGNSSEIIQVLAKNTIQRGKDVGFPLIRFDVTNDFICKCLEGLQLKKEWQLSYQIISDAMNNKSNRDTSDKNHIDKPEHEDRSTPVNRNFIAVYTALSEITRFYTMGLRLVPLALSVLHITAALPAITLQDLEVADDTMSVGSYIREVRAAAPQDYHKSYEHEGDGEVGYSRKKSGGGKKGYQHFDTFHKKAGDNYEFEKSDSYGLEKEGQDAAHSHRHEQREKLKKKPEDAEKIEGDHDEGLGEIEHEELKEGAPDGNGGVEAYGHNPKDYILPEKYTYGEGDEYSF
ncbi:unnamed protein product [Diatraea saccharalis]|uniref:Uncharacterized protein n=1 Tax=Diatraea saccharalis TaxID=40085 RepID=A0A9N9R797_9NEOP|nr:unnamed protein product [Diatraea saccharalis]